MTQRAGYAEGTTEGSPSLWGARAAVAERAVLARHLRRVWALRENLTAYDAAYLALARALDARVLTTDSGLAAAARSDRRLVEL